LTAKELISQFETKKVEGSPSAPRSSNWEEVFDYLK